MIKKADIFLFIILIVFGVFVSVLSLSSSAAGNVVEVTCDGHTFGTYSLSENREITVDIDGHKNIITIQDGKASMSFSSCKNQVCVHTRAISMTNEVIACLPNKVIVKVVSKDPNGGDVDVISG